MYTRVPEGGSTFSGGQRQRLLIARALVRRPRLIFFDEATSALDNATQAVVSSSLASLRASRLLIAHRLSTVKYADTIVVLAGGRVVQTGSYETLVGQEGLFRQLVRPQLA
jgi:ATP-binding cassette subfamily C protein